MTTCRKCGKELQVGAKFCAFCGCRQEKAPTTTRKRGNGQGSAYKRSGSWTAVVVVGHSLKEDGHSVPIRRTKSGFKTKTAALSYCQELLKPQSALKGRTFQEVFDRWATRHEDRVSEITMRGYRTGFAYFSTLHRIHMDKLTPDDLQECIDKSGKGKRTKELMKTTAGLVCKFAVDARLLDRNIAENLYTGKDKKSTRPSFTPAEVELIRQNVGVLPYCDIVYAMIYTGFRPAELFALKKSSYNRQEETLIGGGKTKAGTDRTVPVSPKIQEILHQRAENPNSDYLFCDAKGRPFSSINFSAKFFTPLMDALGIKGRVPYSCRHTFANMLKNVSGADTDKAALMGHSDIAMTRYYQSEELEKMKTIVDSM